MGKIKRWVGTVVLATVVGAGSYVYSATAETTEETTTTTIETTTTTVELDEITWEYSTITKYAMLNGWTCNTINSCNKNGDYVYLYDPTILGRNKININFNDDVTQADLTLLYVDKYGNLISEETITIYPTIKSWCQDFRDVPQGTKYVLFYDVTNIK